MESWTEKLHLNLQKLFQGELPAISSRTCSLSACPTGFLFKSPVESVLEASSCCFTVSATSLGLSAPSVTDSLSPTFMSLVPLTDPEPPGALTDCETSSTCCRCWRDVVNHRSFSNTVARSPSNLAALNAIAREKSYTLQFCLTARRFTDTTRERRSCLLQLS